MRTHEVLASESGGIARSLLRTGVLPFAGRPAEPGDRRVRIFGFYIPPVLSYPLETLGISVNQVHQIVYKPMAVAFENAGFHVTISRVETHKRSLHESAKLAAEEGEFDVEVGHSIGAAVALSLLIHTDLAPRLVIPLCLPLSGTPWRRLARWIEKGTGITPELFEEHEGTLLANAGRIVTFAARGDGIAPHKSCRLSERPTGHMMVDAGLDRPLGHIEAATHPHAVNNLVRLIRQVEEEDLRKARAR